MTSKLKLLGTSAAVLSVVAGFSPALASTNPGTDILNNVSVSFDVGGVTQTAATDSDTFKVDRKVLFTLEENGSLTTTVNPNQQDAVVGYILTNDSNDVLDFTITAANLSGGAAPRGTDNFDANNLLICIDTDNDNDCDTTAAASITVDNLAKDGGIAYILVLGDIAANESDGEIAGIELTATARLGDGTAFDLTGATLPTTDDVSDDTDANTAGVETIFADTSRNGIETALDDYTVDAASLTVTKLSRVVSDGVSTSNWKAIPGAVVEYCIVVSNASGAATATNVAVSDDLALLTDITYDGTFQAKLDGTVVSGDTCTPGATNASYSGGANGIVSGTLTDIAGGETRTLVFRVTID
jgi:uncharacterized repeat protein (TIGR01451 family)